MMIFMILCRKRHGREMAVAVLALWVSTGIGISQETLFTPDPPDPETCDLSVRVFPTGSEEAR